MTAKGESQLMQEILDELDTLQGKFELADATIASLLTTLNTVLDTLVLDVGSAVGASLTADLAVLNTEADTMLTAS